MKKIIYLFVLTILLASCEEEPDNLTVLLDQSGTLSIKVIDNDQSGFKGANVRIFSSIPGGEIIFNDSTGANGICDAGKVLQGQYGYIVSAVKENKTYSYGEYFQVIAGDDKTIETNPFLNIGDASVKIIDINSDPITNTKVALIPHPCFSNVEYIFSELKDEAYAIGETNAEGIVEFLDMPVGLDYSVLAYNSSETYSYPNINNSVYISRGIKRNFTIQCDI